MATKNRTNFNDRSLSLRENKNNLPQENQEDDVNGDEESSDENEDTVVLLGEVVEILRNSKFKVRLPNNNNAIVLGHNSGNMRRHKIKVLLYDKVDIEVSACDVPNLRRKDMMVNGRIIFRHKEI